METWTWDKSALGPGPWWSEPDKAVWVDDLTGLDCMIHRSHLGALCGYVGVGPEHPWYGRSYGDDGPYSVEVHGGLTYADACDESDPEWGICHVPRPGRPTNVWWFGFDCAHGHMDLIPRYQFDWVFPTEYRTWDYVTAEVTTLAHQIAKAPR